MSSKVKDKKKKPAPRAKVSSQKMTVIQKYYTDILAKKREEILQAAKQKEKDFATSDIGDEADVASQTFEKEMLFEVTNSERMILDSIEAALRKLEKGGYGLCESCQKKITAERLRAMPWARYCIECQTKTELPAGAQ